MKAKELMAALFAKIPAETTFDWTCDTCKAGDPEKEIRRVAVTMIATPDIIRETAAWGADLLIVHEPTYYNHGDEHSDEAQETEKRALIESTGMTVYRYHDHPHSMVPDLINAGEVAKLFPDQPVETYLCPHDARFEIKEPMTARQIAERAEQILGIRHIRLCGAVDRPLTHISVMFGQSGALRSELRRQDCEIVLTGECCEWCDCEYVRDAAQLGHGKALILLGHIASEREGMKLLTEMLREEYPDLESAYFESGEPFCD